MGGLTKENLFVFVVIANDNERTLIMAFVCKYKMNSRNSKNSQREISSNCTRTSLNAEFIVKTLQLLIINLSNRSGRI